MMSLATKQVMDARTNLAPAWSTRSFPWANVAWSEHQISMVFSTMAAMAIDEFHRISGYKRCDELTDGQFPHRTSKALRFRWCDHGMSWQKQCNRWHA